MTWTAATETNLDFENATDGLGWTTDEGTPRWPALNDDGGTKGFQGGVSENRTIISRTLAIPSDSKKVRLTAWLGRTDAGPDQCIATVYLYDAGANLVGGVTLGSVDNSTDERVQYVGEAIVPASATSCTLEVASTRNGNAGNNVDGACASTAVEWFIDAGLTIYTTPNFIENGDFELGDSPPTGWEHVSGNGLISTTDANYVFEGTYGGWCNNGATQISQQTVYNVPSGAEGCYFYFVAMTTDPVDSADRPISRLTFLNAADVELDEIEIHGPCAGLSDVPQTLTKAVLPVGTAKIIAQVELVLSRGSAVDAGFDAAELVFTSETAPIDVTPKFYVRQQDDSWLHLNPVFAGAGLAGLVPDPGTESGNFLRDDGTWQAAGGGGGGHIISEDLVDFTQRTNLDFDGDDFDITDDAGNDATLVALSADVIADLVLANTALQNVVEDTTPQLGGDLDGQQQELQTMLRLLIDHDGIAYGGSTQPVAHVDFSGTATSTQGTAVGAIPPAVHYRATTSFPSTSTNAFGTGFLFWNQAKLIMEAGGARNFGGFYGLASQTVSTVRQDAGATPTTATSFFWFDILSQPQFGTEDTSTHTINAGASLVGEVQAGSGVTLSDWSEVLARQPAQKGGTSGTITRLNGVGIEDLGGAGATKIVATNYAHVNIGKGASYTGRFGVLQTNDDPHRWNAAHFHRFDSYSTAQNITTAHGSAELTGTTARTFTLTTPPAADVGRRHKFYNSATANLTIATAGAEQIGGAATQVIGAGSSLEVEWNGTAWVI